MSELPPNAGPPDDVDDRYRRAAALDPSRPSDSVRRAVLEHASKLAAERSAAQEAQDVPTTLGVERSAANQRWWRPAVFGALAAAGLAGLLIAPQYLPPRAPVTVAQSKMEATPPRIDAAPSQSPLPPPPLRAHRQSMAKDRTAAGNAVAKAESAQDKASSDAVSPTAGLAGRMTAARNRESEATLLRAAESGDVVGLQAQLEKRSDIDARDAGGRTALMLATLHGQLPAVEALLGAGADANAADGDGVTPLQAAMNANQPAIAATLRRAGAR